MILSSLSFPPLRIRAFTLVELIIAIILIAMLGSATFVSLSQGSRAREKSAQRADALDHARIAADLIAGDLSTTLRDPDLLSTRLALSGSAGSSNGGGNGGATSILLFGHLPSRIRPDSGQNEGAEAEMEYRVKPGEHALWRRIDPVPDEYPDAGGVAERLVSGIDSLAIQAYDGSSWLDTWDSDRDGLPQAIRITVVGRDDAGKVTLPIRRVIAFDRVPIPAEVEPDPTLAATTATTTGGSQ